MQCREYRPGDSAAPKTMDLGQRIYTRYGRSPGVISLELGSGLARDIFRFSNRLPLLQTLQQRWNIDRVPFSTLTNAVWLRAVSTPVPVKSHTLSARITAVPAAAGQPANPPSVVASQEPQLPTDPHVEHTSRLVPSPEASQTIHGARSESGSIQDIRSHGAAPSAGTQPDISGVSADGTTGTTGAPGEKASTTAPVNLPSPVNDKTSPAQVHRSGEIVSHERVQEIAVVNEATQRVHGDAKTSTQPSPQHLFTLPMTGDENMPSRAQRHAFLPLPGGAQLGPAIFLRQAKGSLSRAKQVPAIAAEGKPPGTSSEAGSWLSTSKSESLPALGSQEIARSVTFEQASFDGIATGTAAPELLQRRLTPTFRSGTDTSSTASPLHGATGDIVSGVGERRDSSTRSNKKNAFKANSSSPNAEQILTREIDSSPPTPGSVASPLVLSHSEAPILHRSGPRELVNSSRQAPTIPVSVGPSAAVETAGKASEEADVLPSTLVHRASDHAHYATPVVSADHARAASGRSAVAPFVQRVAPSSASSRMDNRNVPLPADFHAGPASISPSPAEGGRTRPVKPPVVRNADVVIHRAEAGVTAAPIRSESGLAATQPELATNVKAGMNSGSAIVHRTKSWAPPDQLERKVVVHADPKPSASTGAQPIVQARYSVQQESGSTQAAAVGSEPYASQVQRLTEPPETANSLDAPGVLQASGDVARAVLSLPTPAATQSISGARMYPQGVTLPNPAGQLPVLRRYPQNSSPPAPTVPKRWPGTTVASASPATTLGNVSRHVSPPGASHITHALWRRAAEEASPTELNPPVAPSPARFNPVQRAAATTGSSAASAGGTTPALPSLSGGNNQRSLALPPGELARLTNRVYELLVRRLAAEKQRRGL